METEKLKELVEQLLAEVRDLREAVSIIRIDAEAAGIA